MSAAKILIVSFKNDLHALAIKKSLEERNVDVFLLDSDRISVDYELSWKTNKQFESQIKFPSNKILNLDEISLIWWRRIARSQNIGARIRKGKYTEFVDKNCLSGLRSKLILSHKGKWISNPYATERACDKIYQLKIAEECGLTIPNTLISNSPEEVKKFYYANNENIIVKPLAAASHSLLARKVNLQRLQDENIRICPSIYQENVPGCKHLRINFFGKDCYAFLLDSKNLDWRPNLEIPIEACEIPFDIKNKLLKVLKKMDLEMGVFDMKITPNNKYVWFEVNPQGQFLFLDAYTKMDLQNKFADYLIKTCGSDVDNQYKVS